MEAPITQPPQINTCMRSCSRPRQDPISYPQIGRGTAGSLAQFAFELTLPARGANVVRDPMETGPI